MRRIAAFALVLLALVIAAPAAVAAPPPRWHPDVAAARAWAQRRVGDVSFAVRTERRGWSWRGATPYRSASIVKAMLMVAYLRRADVRHRRLRADERALLDPMIRSSDNRAANVISARVGLRALAALARRVGMRHFIPHPVWGGSTVTAVDQARLFLRIDRLVPRRHRAYAVGLLRRIVAGQRWGIPAARPAGWRIAFKGGWGMGVTRQVDHQAALLTNRGLRVSIAVMTADSVTDGYGAATIEGLAARLLRGLAGTVKGKYVRVRCGFGRPQWSRRLSEALAGAGQASAAEREPAPAHAEAGALGFPRAIPRAGEERAAGRS